MYSRLACRAASLSAWTAASPRPGAQVVGNGARRTATAYGTTAAEMTKTVASSSVLLMRPLEGARLAGTWELFHSAWGTGGRHAQAFSRRGLFSISPCGGSRGLSTQKGRDDAGQGDQEADGDDADEAGKGSEPSNEAVVVALKEDLAKTEDQLEDTRGKVLYLAAEMENVRAIAKRDAEGARLYAVQKFAKQLLDVADNLERAVVSAKEGGGSGGDSPYDVLLEGVEMTSDELQKVFRSQGLEKYGEVGDKFDPHLHDAMFAYPDPAQEPGTVGQVLKYGYKLHGRVIRAAQVGTVTEA